MADQFEKLGKDDITPKGTEKPRKYRMKVFHGRRTPRSTIRRFIASVSRSIILKTIRYNFVNINGNFMQIFRIYV